MLKNSISSYGLITKALHWFSAVFILCAMSLGIWFAVTDLETDYGWDQFERFIDWHVGFGISVLILMLPRLVWRLTNTTPDAQQNSHPTQAKLAHFVHILLYTVAILTPLTGWLGSSLEGHTLHYFSVFEIKPYFGTHTDLALLMTNAHFYLSWGCFALLTMHLSAVIYHQFWLKDRILKRML